MSAYRHTCTPKDNRYLTQDFVHALLPADIRKSEFSFRNRFVVLHREGY